MAALRARAIEDLPHLITSEEFEEMDEWADGQHELIEGRIEKKAMPGDEHGTIVMKIIKRIAKLDPDDKLGKGWVNTNFKLETHWNPEPDFAFVVAAKVKPVTKKSVNVIPDLVVEVNSPEDLNTIKKRERVAQKIAKYQEKGVSIIWSITPATRTVKVYHPDQIEPVQELDINGELDGENIIPGLVIKVAELFQ